MKVLVLAGAVPFRTHGEPGVIAANLVFAQLIRGLKALGHEVALQCLLHHSRTLQNHTDAETRELKQLESEGIHVLPTIFPKNYDVSRRTQSLRALRLMVSAEERADHFYPGIRLAPRIRESIKQSACDVAISLWSPAGAAALWPITECTRVTYQGDIDYLPHLWQFRDRQLFRNNATTSPLTLMDQRLRLSLFKKTHHELMLSLDGIANIDAGNADYYTNLGHPLSVYARNMWIAPDLPAEASAKAGPVTVSTAPPPVSGRPIKIIGHAGYLDRTGSTYGLQFLLSEVMPALTRELKGIPYEVHIIGGGKPIPALRPLLNQEHLVLRGFVPDLDEELRSSHAFCILNNAGPFHACYTRHLVAWSMGLALIAHRGSVVPIPEIRDGENALLGSTGAEVAAAIGRVVRDEALSRRVRDEGRRTFLDSFTPEVVCNRVADVLEKAIARHRLSP